MKTLEEAVSAWLADSEGMIARYKDICDQLNRNPDVLLAVIAIRDSQTAGAGLLTALRIGLIIGIEMEKGSR